MNFYNSTVLFKNSVMFRFLYQIKESYLNKCRFYSVLNKLIYNEQLARLEKNCILRKHENNVPVIRNLVDEYIGEENQCRRNTIHKKLIMEMEKLPNGTHPRTTIYGNTPKDIMTYSNQPFPSLGHEFSKICKHFKIIRTEHLRNYTGHKSYYLIGSLAEMEQAVIQYTLSFLKARKLKLISVPDILPPEIIYCCGMQTEGDRTQVYKIDSEKCLSGTAEMALAGYFKNNLYEEKDLPLTVAAVSRCFRAETSGLHEEKGIYRVHNFTKVEMFSICSGEQSEDVLEFLKEIEVELFKNLNLTFKVLDMPSSELGFPAYQKYDIEAWMSGRKMWGEISSCSNCTDYQAKRLNIKYRSNTGKIKYVHTINGTAAAIPRLLIALVESRQADINKIILSTVLKQFMKTDFQKCKNILPEIKFSKCVKLSN